MILVFETNWTGTVHVPGNSATVQVIAQAFPGQTVRVHAAADHLAELRRDPAFAALANVETVAVAVPAQHPGRLHLVSARRFRGEFALLRAALKRVPADAPVLVMLLSATSTALFAASWAVRLAGRRRRAAAAVQIGLHGNLNDALGWRSRNPLRRRFDLAAALAAPPPRLRFLVLEEAIRDAMRRFAPLAAARTDVLPLPVNPGEDAAIAAAPIPLTAPLRIGFVGTATAAKGIDIFLDLARRLGARFGGRIAFHLVGRALPGGDPARFAALAEPVGTAQLPRAEFLRRLARLHYVLLPYQPGYYDLSASGALLDAVTWRKPVIALRVPIAAAMFAAADQPIGVLCDDAAGLEEAVADIATRMDAGRYAREVAALERLRAARQPAALAARYAALVRAGFPEIPLS